MSTENGNIPISMEKCTVLLLDVAGTTTSINFVKDTLFPFVIKNSEEFLKANWEDEAVKEAVKLLKDGDAEIDLAAATELVKSLTKEESDNKGLKSIQGLIYKKGYENNDLKAHVFSDVSAALKKLSSTYKIAIYSTGSTESQKLLFSHTVEGDLSEHITKYYDQSVGLKTDASSYQKIAEDLNIKPEDIVFVSDDVEETKAAKSVGVVTVLITREGNASLPEGAGKDFPVVASFSELCDKPGKRKNTEDETVTSEEPPTKVAKIDPVESTSNENVEKTSEQTKVEEPVEAMEVDDDVEMKEAPAAVKETNKDVPDMNDKSSGVPAENTENIDQKTTEKTEETLSSTPTAVKNNDEPMDVCDEAKSQAIENEAKNDKPIVEEKKLATEIKKPAVENQKLDTEDQKAATDKNVENKEQKQDATNDSQKTEEKTVSETDAQIQNGELKEEKKVAEPAKKTDEISQEKSVTETQENGKVEEAIHDTKDKKTVKEVKDDIEKVTNKENDTSKNNKENESEKNVDSTDNTDQKQAKVNSDDSKTDSKDKVMETEEVGAKGSEEKDVCIEKSPVESAEKVSMDVETKEGSVTDTTTKLAEKSNEILKSDSKVESESMETEASVDNKSERENVEKTDETKQNENAVECIKNKIEKVDGAEMEPSNSEEKVDEKTSNTEVDSTTMVVEEVEDKTKSSKMAETIQDKTTEGSKGAEEKSEKVVECSTPQEKPTATSTESNNTSSDLHTNDKAVSEVKASEAEEKMEAETEKVCTNSSEPLETKSEDTKDVEMKDLDDKTSKKEDASSSKCDETSTSATENIASGKSDETTNDTSTKLESDAPDGTSSTDATVNGSATEIRKENGEKAENEEKENKSELANGLSKDNEEPVANGENGDTQPETSTEKTELEVVDKIKKAENTTAAESSPAVSVEV